MIASFRHKGLQLLSGRGDGRIHIASIEGPIERPPGGNGPSELRVVFRFEEGSAFDVDLIDYH